MKLVLILTLSFAIFSCTKGPDSPEGLIKMFVKEAATKKLDREYYEKYTTGELLESIENTTDEQLEKDSRLNGVSSVSVKIMSKNCQNNNCVVTYIVEYKTESKSESTFSSEVKKVAEVEKIGEEWKISSVRNIKTFHESKEPINPMQDEEPKPEYETQE